MKTKHHLKFWGSIENQGLAKSLLGTDKTDFWFASPADRDVFKTELKLLAKKHNRIVVFSEHDGESAKSRTVAVLEFEYKGKSYPYRYDFGYGHSTQDAHYSFYEGNYSCDCNKSLFIRENDETFAELSCGDEIVIKNFQFSFDA